MQGCPLSCLLLNALVSVITKDVMYNVPKTCIQSYVDDITFLHKDLRSLQEAVHILKPYLTLTDQKLNVNKTYAFAVNGGDFEVHFNGVPLPKSNAVKILGIKLYFGDGGVSFHYVDKDFDFIDPALARIRASGLLFWARSLVIGGSVLSRILYGSEIRQMSDVEERTIKNATTAAVWGSSSTKRTPGILFTLLTKGHVLDITQASLTSRWLKIVRAVRNDPSLGDLIFRNVNLVRRKKLKKSGPGEALYQAERRLNIIYETSTSIRCDNTVFDLLTCDLGKFAHTLRNLARRMVWRQTRSDAIRVKREVGAPLPHLHDVGKEHGVDRDGTMKLYNMIHDNPTKGILRTIICNGVWTNSARARLPRNEGLSPLCPYCTLGKTESLIHIWWECQAWQSIRRDIFPYMDNPYVDLNMSESPMCTQTCGIRNERSHVTPDLLVNIQTMMVRIFRERALRQRE